MNDRQAEELIQKYLQGDCSPEETSLLNTWYNLRSKGIANELPEPDYIFWQNQIARRLPQSTKRIRLWPKVAAAAVLIFIFLGIYFVTHREPNQEQVLQTIAQMAKPGGDRAILTLSNGRQIILTNARNGKLATEGNSLIQKTEDGKVVYSTDSINAKKEVTYNTITTPSGGVYSLVLADGTMVMLDAGSSIRYPVDFTGTERRVEVTGQAYFSVAHDRSKPFRITSNSQTVEVLGTRFNINTYPEDKVATTTLIEGSVKVSNAGKTAILKPGEQSFTHLANDEIKLSKADIETVLAWKNGLFSFRHADLPTVMRQFARWYNVDVVYEGKVPGVSITGKVFRSANASQILEILLKLGIKFKVEGKTIIVLQNK